MSKRWSDDNKPITSVTPLLYQNDNKPITIREDKIIGDKIREKKKEVKFTPPILEDVKKYFADNGYSEYSSEKAFNYYNEADWVDSKGNKIRNWKQKMIAVWFKPENKQQDQQKRGMVY